jgi:hypothetical protein
MVAHGAAFQLLELVHCAVTCSSSGTLHLNIQLPVSHSGSELRRRAHRPGWASCVARRRGSRDSTVWTGCPNTSSPCSSNSCLGSHCHPSTPIPNAAHVGLKLTYTASIISAAKGELDLPSREATILYISLTNCGD